MSSDKLCWCGNNEFAYFSNEYSRCLNCDTLVSIAGLPTEKLLVGNDETDFYGKQYWLNHQNQDLGFPDIYSRARNDLIERNLHWLKTLLKYKLPPAKVLELGCSHGSFVALAKQTGYDSAGMEMSPWVVEFGKKTFDITVHTGPIENTSLAPQSFDVISLMDVLEHLPDPKATMQHCLNLLKEDGILLIQTPQFQEDMVHDDLVAANSRFLEQLKYDEHLFLFTKDSVAQMFRELGAEYIKFEPAIFAVYDMFFVVSRTPVEGISDQAVTEHLMSSPKGRFVQALLDLYDQNKGLMKQIDVIEADRAARLEQIITLTDMVKNLQKT